MQTIPNTQTNAESRRLFKLLKPICIPLLQNSRLTPDSTPVASSLLKDLLQLLEEQSVQPLDEALLKYIFFPISGIIRQNPPSTIPDHVMERIFAVVTVLVESWWWTMDKVMWEKLVALCSTAIPITGGAFQRSEETQVAAVRCLWELLRVHAGDENSQARTETTAKEQIQIFSTVNIPLLAQVLTSLLVLTSSREQSLQILSLRCILLLVENFLGEKYIPTVMPGIISALSRLIPRREGSTHQRGEIVKWSFTVMQSTIALGIGDDICVKEGLIRVYNSLDDFSYPLPEHEALLAESPMAREPGVAVQRTLAWLNATSAQLHNAMNVLIPRIIDHPTPSASQGLVEFCEATLITTTLTLPQSQGLLLVPLLLLSLHSLPEISGRSQKALITVLAKSITSPTILQAFTKLGEDSLFALPCLLISGHSDRLLRALRILTAIATLSRNGLGPISKNISHILGPSGGIEKWGWGMLDGLALSIPNIYFAPPNVEALLIQNSTNNDTPIFPEVTMEHVESAEIQPALAIFFRSWGRAAGDDALFAVEWFIGYASNGAGTSQVSALWCAARLLEGVAYCTLVSTGEANSDARRGTVTPRSSRLRQHARWLVKHLASFWERDLEEEMDPLSPGNDQSENMRHSRDDQLVEFVKGMQPLESLLDMGKNAKATNTEALRETQRVLYRVQALHLLALGSSILDTRFSPLLTQAIYPILYSLVSTHPFLSATAQSTLLHVARACGYASASNLLLSNFDYALGSVSRYLTRQRLDLHAPRVFVILVRLVGKGVIDRAADVVEECFERLDDYHGYRMIVEGLVEVLLEVVRAVDRDGNDGDDKAERTGALPRDERREKIRSDMTEFVEWYRVRNVVHPSKVEEDFGPHPRRAWGKDEEAEAEGSDTKMEDGPPKLSPTQKLVQQVLNKSIYFLTHPSAVIRARVLSVLTSSISTLSSVESSLLPTIHLAWPFILNRFKNIREEPFVVVEAAELIRALVANVGDFMDAKIWEDIWPIFRTLMQRLDAGDKHSALARRKGGLPSIGTESAYTTSHRLYCAILSTISLAIAEVTLSDQVAWEVLLLCRRFMSDDTHGELQALARGVYLEMARKNADAVWLVLGGAGSSGPAFLVMESGRRNAEIVFEAMD